MQISQSFLSVLLHSSNIFAFCIHSDAKTKDFNDERNFLTQIPFDYIRMHIVLADIQEDASDYAN